MRKQKVNRLAESRKDFDYCLDLARKIGLGTYSKTFSYVGPTHINLRYDKTYYMLEISRSSHYHRFLVTIYPAKVSNCEIRVQLKHNRDNKTVLAKKIKGILRGIRVMA
jgi:hypothetical protein